MATLPRRESKAALEARDPLPKCLNCGKIDEYMKYIFATGALCSDECDREFRRDLGV